MTTAKNDAQPIGAVPLTLTWPSPRTIDQTLEIAEEFATYFRGLASTDPDNVDLYCILSVASDYVSTLQMIRDRKRLDETEFYRVRNASMLAGVLIEELHDDYKQQLDEWFFGQDGTILWHIANILTDALQTFLESMEYRRKRNYEPLTDAEFAAIARIIDGIPLDDEQA